ncbi:MAG: hypothetical protein IJU55_05885 [Selenomonadaceae bacterium]|nr:hypothetical protein [Selenomonadaceae bacterium]
MAIQGIGGVNSTASFMQSNLQAERLGGQATAVRMHESNPHLSSSGTETNLGTSEFSKTNEETIEVSVDRISEIMEKDDEYTEFADAGTGNPFAASGFQDLNNTSADKQQQIAVAARAYSYFNE